MTYGYDTKHPSARIYTRKGIKDEASKLLESLLELRKEVEEVRPKVAVHAGPFRGEV